MARTFGTAGAIQTVPSQAGSLGQGIAYPVRITPQGRLALSWGVQSVIDSVASICQTGPGERVMEPDYGGDVATFDTVNPERTQHQIAAAIAAHEPRVGAVSVSSELGEQNAIDVRVEFEVRGHDTSSTLTFPYFTGPSI